MCDRITIIIIRTRLPSNGNRAENRYSNPLKAEKNTETVAVQHHEVNNECHNCILTTPVTQRVYHNRILSTFIITVLPETKII